MKLRTLLIILLCVAATVYLATRFLAAGWGLSANTTETIEGGAMGAGAGLLLWLILDLLGRKPKGE